MIDNELHMMLVGLMLGFMFTTLGAFIYISVFSDTSVAIQECEKTIPRNQHCEIEIIATPIKLEKDE